MKRLFIILAFILISMPIVNAQYDTDFDEYTDAGWLWTFDYSMAFTSGDMANYISDPTYRGFGIQARHFFLDNKLSAGISFSWNGFYQDFGRRMEEFDGGAITSNMYRYLYTTNLDANLHFYPMDKESFIQPYIGIQAGPHYINKQAQVGSYLIEDDTWRFAFAPELGVTVPFGKDSEWGFHTSARWNYTFFNRTNFESITYVHLNVGLSYSY